jgi:REP element-mobilizing transposase RayT
MDWSNLVTPVSASPCHVGTTEVATISRRPSRQDGKRSTDCPVWKTPIFSGTAMSQMSASPCHVGATEVATISRRSFRQGDKRRTECAVGKTPIPSDTAMSQSRRMRKTTFPGSRALRHGRISTPGHHCLVTTICRERERRFAWADVAGPLAAAIADPALWREASLLCWVLMPDHLHALIGLGPAESLPKLMQRVKSVAAAITNASQSRRGAVWMPGYHDRGIRSEAMLLPMARYVIANPVRAGLVARVSDYPYWGCAWSSGAGDDPVG